MVSQTTKLWVVFTVEDGDILNCRCIALDSRTAIDILTNLALEDLGTNFWYKVVQYNALGTFHRNDHVYIVVDHTPDGDLHIKGVYDQYEVIPQRYRDEYGEDIYWVDNMTIV